MDRVRATIIIIVALAIIIGFFVNKVEQAYFTSIASMVLGYLFGSEKKV
jgi:hypothetical protein